MALKTLCVAELVGRTIEPSKAKGSYCYTFVQGDKMSTGLYIEPFVLTYWSKDDLKGPSIKFGSKFELEVKVSGDITQVISIKPIPDKRDL